MEGSLKYLLYVPDAYNRTPTKWPLVLFLHGAGERGDDLELVEKHGPPKLIAQGREFPAIIVSPQCPKDTWWTDHVAALEALLDEIVARYRVDEDRIYVTGISMGGFGTWALAFDQPQRFAALGVICGRGDPAKAALLKHVPIWVFHGAKDQTVPLKDSQDMVEALQAAGGSPKFTVYPDAGHDSWTRTYEDPAFWEWLFAQRRR
ncbi:MAG: prolyl oligopeptidase family serine peptidase [Phycisphaerae bacterium]